MIIWMHIFIKRVGFHCIEATSRAKKNIMEVLVHHDF